MAIACEGKRRLAALADAASSACRTLRCRLTVIDEINEDLFAQLGVSALPNAGLLLAAVRTQSIASLLLAAVTI